MKGKIFAYAITNAAATVAKKNPQRRRITFAYATVNDGSVATASLLDGEDRTATAALGCPVGICPLVLEGELATHQFSCIRQFASDGVLGVIEQFDEDRPDDVETSKEA